MRSLSGALLDPELFLDKPGPGRASSETLAVDMPNDTFRQDGSDGACRGERMNVAKIAHLLWGIWHAMIEPPLNQLDPPP